MLYPALVVALTVSSISFADNPQGFEERKTEMLANMDKRIAALQENKACIAAASSPDAIKECGKKMSESRKEFMKHQMGRRKQEK